MNVNSESGFWIIIKTILIIMLVSNVMKWILKTVSPNVDPVKPDVHAAKESEQNARMPEHVLRYKISLLLYFIRIMTIFL